MTQFKTGAAARPAPAARTPGLLPAAAGHGACPAPAARSALPRQAAAEVAWLWHQRGNTRHDAGEHVPPVTQPRGSAAAVRALWLSPLITTQPRQSLAAVLVTTARRVLNAEPRARQGWPGRANEMPRRLGVGCTLWLFCEQRGKSRVRRQHGARECADDQRCPCRASPRSADRVDGAVPQQFLVLPRLPALAHAALVDAVRRLRNSIVPRQRAGKSAADLR
jgi:hypothetical protein